MVAPVWRNSRRSNGLSREEKKARLDHLAALRAGTKTNVDPQQWAIVVSKEEKRKQKELRRKLEEQKRQARKEQEEIDKMC